MTRKILRVIHLILAVPIIGYIYSPFEVLPDYAFKTRFIFVPAIALTGLWMWKGPALMKLFASPASKSVLER